jgi:type IV pilus assembly protein PilC
MKYKYKAVTDVGKYINGEIDAVDMRVAASMVREQKMTPISVTPKNEAFDLSAISGKFGGVTTTEVTNFTRQLSTMITAGLPLTDALNLLKLQSAPKFSAVIGAILLDVQGGVSLSESMGKHMDVFSKVYVALVKAGESAGVMDTILNRLADSMEKSREFGAKVKGALVYPVIVIVGMILVMVVMMVAVVPKLSTLYVQFDAQLPLSTQLIVGLSNFMVNFWWLALPIVAGLFFAIRARSP